MADLQDQNQVGQQPVPDQQGVDTPTPEPQAPEVDADLQQAEAAFRRELEALGGKFDASGQFLGWEFDTTQTPAPAEPQPAPDQQPAPKKEEPQMPTQDFSQMRRVIANDIAPVSVKVLLDSIVAEDASFTEVRAEAEKILSTVDPLQLNPNTVRTALLVARGAKTPVLIEKAKKAAQEDAKAAAASYASVEGGGEVAASPPTKGRITKEIADHAKTWGLDPQELANELEVERSRKNG